MKLLDLFCCEGGAAMGYYQAGFDVVGVDLFEDYTQSRYPFKSIKGDVFNVLDQLPPVKNTVLPMQRDKISILT